MQHKQCNELNLIYSTTNISESWSLFVRATQGTNICIKIKWQNKCNIIYLEE